MRRNLLLLTYAFPPANIIGAVRPYQMARYFQERGWNVSVIFCADSTIQDTYTADVSGMTSVRLAVPRLVCWLNAISARKGGCLGKWASIAERGLKFLVRSAIYPEHFRSLAQDYVREALQLAQNKRFDLLISSALPFTVHVAGRQVAEKLDIPWIADNRDLWAASPYRKGAFFRRWLDRRYEREILASAKFVLGVSSGMIDYYRDVQGFHNALLVMNGYAQADGREKQASVKPSDFAGLDIIYGGILYGTLRDPSPLLKAISLDERLQQKTRVRFFGSERDRVEVLSGSFERCAIQWHERVSKAEIGEIYRGASLLLVILGRSDFENGVLTGKFFEYLAFGKPVLAVAPENSELARIVNQYGLGLASQDPAQIAAYLNALLDGTAPAVMQPPPELSIEFQLSRLYDACGLAAEGNGEK